MRTTVDKEIAQIVFFSIFDLSPKFGKLHSESVRRFLRDRVVSAFKKGIAPQYSFGSQKESLDGPIFLKSLQRIIGARRIESAAGRIQRRNTNLIETNRSTVNFCQNIFHDDSVYDFKSAGRNSTGKSESGFINSAFSHNVRS